MCNESFNFPTTLSRIQKADEPMNGTITLQPTSKLNKSKNIGASTIELTSYLLNAFSKKSAQEFSLKIDNDLDKNARMEIKLEVKGSTKGKVPPQHWKSMSSKDIMKSESPKNDINKNITKTTSQFGEPGSLESTPTKENQITADPRKKNLKTASKGSSTTSNAMDLAMNKSMDIEQEDFSMKVAQEEQLDDEDKNSIKRADSNIIFPGSKRLSHRSGFLVNRVNYNKMFRKERIKRMLS